MAKLAGSALSINLFVSALATALLLPALIEPFAVLAAGLYTQAGPAVYFALIAAALLASLLAHRLSQSVDRSQQRSRELARLEQLGRGIIDSPPDASALPDLLAEYVPAMFPFSQVEIRLFPDRILLHHPPDAPASPAHFWDWLQSAPPAQAFLPQAQLPWRERLPAQTAVVFAPIVSAEGSEPIGGIILSQHRDVKAAPGIVPAVQSLAAQVASALNRARAHEQTLAHEKVKQELAFAGKIQASFLPNSVPQIDGWQIAVKLQPARETSGDFYDFIQLADGRLGIVLADVSDKGTGAALYMALSRTLIRTYATEYPAQPDLALGAANRRILADTQTDQFVTVFYGVLDPAGGELAYCNAGHNPAYLFARDGRDVCRLGTTGMPLGMFEEASWQTRSVHFAPGDVLLIYSDGVTEAQDGEGRQFGEARMLDIVQAHRAGLAREMQEVLSAGVRAFTGDTPQYDDMTHLIVVREDAKVSTDEQRINE
jgi:serine phosphatase RsbU (regulator of sigma subunit)